MYIYTLYIVIVYPVIVSFVCTDDEVYSYKERLRPPSTDEEEKDTHTEEETSTVSTSEKQRNQNRVKDILRGGKGLPHSR